MKNENYAEQSLFAKFQQFVFHDVWSVIKNMEEGHSDYYADRISSLERKILVLETDKINCSAPTDK